MIRLLAIDLDGTLLNSDRLIPDLNKVAIARAVKQGVVVVPASGRIAPSIRPFSEQLGLDGTMVCCNGAHVICGPSTELVHLGLSEPATRLIIEYAFEAKEHLNLYCREKLYFTSDPEWGEVYLSRVRTIIPETITKEQALTLQPTKAILVADPARMAQHCEYLKANLTLGETDLVFSEPDYLELLPAGASKASGLDALSRHLGIAREETAAIGDYFNDQEMIEWAGVGVAMGNAPKELQAIADIITKSNDECGVAAFIQDYVLKD